jgi:adenosylmethionine-8-amino-7-oxononanoate aminotransferase
MFAGVELVADKHSKRPFTPAANVATRAAKLALDEGVIVYPCSGSTAEEGSDSLLVAPPYVTTESDLERMATRLARALHRLERELA